MKNKLSDSFNGIPFIYFDEFGENVIRDICDFLSLKLEIGGEIYSVGNEYWCNSYLTDLGLDFTLENSKGFWNCVFQEQTYYYLKDKVLVSSSKNPNDIGNE